MWGSKGDFLLNSEEGSTLMEWIPGIQLHNHLPSRSVPRQRPCTKVIYDSSTSLVVAASSQLSKFASYDEDGNIVWEPDAPNISFPNCECSTLELISPEPEGWVTMDGFESAQKEFVTCLDCVTLETTSTGSGMMDFIAVGTTINCREDLAVKGAVYIFSIVEVVPDVKSKLKRW